MANPRTIARLEGQIHRRVAHCLQFELSDPRTAFITVTGVELSKDLAHARVSYSVLGDDAERSRVEHLLDGARGFVQRKVAGILRTRTVPRLRWAYDDGAPESARMDKLIREARERDRRISGESRGHETDESPESEPETEPETGLETELETGAGSDEDPPRTPD